MIINKQVKLTAEISRGIVFCIPSSLCLGAVDATAVATVSTTGVPVTCGGVEVGANTC